MDDYSLSATNQWFVSISNSSSGKYNCYLHATITVPKEVVIADGSSKSFELQPYETNIINRNASDITDSNQIDYDKSYREWYLRTNELPSRKYTVCVEVIESGKGAVLAKACQDFEPQKFRPPVNIYPFDRDTVKGRIGKPVLKNEPADKAIPKSEPADKAIPKSEPADKEIPKPQPAEMDNFSFTQYIDLFSTGARETQFVKDGMIRLMLGNKGATYSLIYCITGSDQNIIVKGKLPVTTGLNKLLIATTDLKPGKDEIFYLKLFRAGAGLPEIRFKLINNSSKR